MSGRRDPGPEPVDPAVAGGGLASGGLDAGPTTWTGRTLEALSGSLRTARNFTLVLAAALLAGIPLFYFAGSSPGVGYHSLIHGSLGSHYGIGETLIETMPLFSEASPLAAVSVNRYFCCAAAREGRPSASAALTATHSAGITVSIA